MSSRIRLITVAVFCAAAISLILIKVAAPPADTDSRVSAPINPPASSETLLESHEQAGVDSVTGEVPSTRVADETPEQRGIRIRKEMKQLASEMSTYASKATHSYFEIGQVKIDARENHEQFEQIRSEIESATSRFNQRVESLPRVRQLTEEKQALQAMSPELNKERRDFQLRLRRNAADMEARVAMDAIEKTIRENTERIQVISREMEKIIANARVNDHICRDLYLYIQERQHLISAQLNELPEVRGLVAKQQQYRQEHAMRLERYDALKKELRSLGGI